MLSLNVAGIPFSIVFYYLLLLPLSLSGCVSKTIESRSGDEQEAAWVNLPQIKSATFSDINTAWLVTYKEGQLLRTEDGGKSWNKIPADVYDKSNKARFSQVSFVDSQRGWAVNVHGQVWRTISGGRQWTEIANLASDKPNSERFIAAEQIKFTDELHGWIIATYIIWHTQDGGASWTQVFSASDPRVKGQPVRGSFLNRDKAWICGTDGEVYHTADGGKTWSVQTMKNAGFFSDIFFIDEKTGWLSSGAGGQLYRTDDGGETWQLQPELDKKDTYIETMWFLSKDEGWGVARQVLEGSTRNMPQNVERNLTRGIVLHTLDGGKTWQTVDIGKVEPFFHRVYFADTQHGWLFSRDNTYRTDNGGKSWSPVLKLPPIKSAGSAFN